MSIALKWGLISSRYLVKHIKEKYPNELANKQEGIMQYISELIWREFYKYILLNNSTVLNLEFQDKFKNKIEWKSGQQAIEIFKKWILGQTGYPVVDAAMQEIAKTGLMHNRSRMVVASILTKNLGIDWRWGQAYFRMMLIDLDEASNNGGWQWAGSVGADPKPIRIFNPYLQSQNFDKTQKYQKFWLPKNYIADQNPIIEHALARQNALLMYNLQTKNSNTLLAHPLNTQLF
jgi:deoxyribodipyrimidine photo-lyase